MGILNSWLRNIRDVYRLHEAELNSIINEEERYKRLIELNVQEQVMNLAKTSIVQKAWKNNHYPHLHGWVYSINNGIINPIFEMTAGSHLDQIYEFDNL